MRIDGPLFTALRMDGRRAKHSRRFLGFHLVVQTAGGVVRRGFLRLEEFWWASETTEALAGVIVNVIGEYGLRPQVIVTDTAANITKAAKLVAASLGERGEVELWPCTCHLLNPVQKAFVKPLALIKDATFLRDVFWRNTWDLTAWLPQKGCTRYAAPDGTEIRWSSFAHALETFLALREYMGEFLASNPSIAGRIVAAH
jgi:hypothetical protein